jgi:hypothetical protein
MTNKVGFTEEQQRELCRLICMATHVARVTTESVIGSNEAIAEELRDLIDFVKFAYPNGPMHLKESLDNIARFCDLDSIIIARGPDAPL